MGIPENIDALLLRYDINQEALARIVGVSQAAVSGWRHNKRPSNANVKKICAYFGLEPNDILSDTYGLAAQERGEVIKRPGRPIAASEPAFLPMRRLGRVHAGDPDEEYEDDGEVMVPAKVASGHPNGFVLTVVGGCMDNEIPEGYDAVVDPDASPRNGCVAVVEVEPGEALMRRWTLAGRTLVLSADSHTEEHDDIVLSAQDAPRLIGVVVWAQRDMERA